MTHPTTFFSSASLPGTTPRGPRRRLLVVLVALVLLAGCGTGLERKPPSTLPKMTLVGLGEARSIDLRTLKGPAVLNFWAQSCGPCRKELPRYQQFHAANPALRVIGVDTLDTQPVLARRMLSRAGVTYEQVTDPDGKALTGRYLPQLVMVDAKGKVVYRRAIQIHSVAQLTALVKKHLG